jgi:hypothetical protein
MYKRTIENTNVCSSVIDWKSTSDDNFTFERHTEHATKFNSKGLEKGKMKT